MKLRKIALLLDEPLSTLKCVDGLRYTAYLQTRSALSVGPREGEQGKGEGGLKNECVLSCRGY